METSKLTKFMIWSKSLFFITILIFLHPLVRWDVQVLQNKCQSSLSVKLKHPSHIIKPFILLLLSLYSQHVTSTDCLGYCFSPIQTIVTGSWLVHFGKQVWLYYFGFYFTFIYLPLFGNMKTTTITFLSCPWFTNIHESWHIHDLYTATFVHPATCECFTEGIIQPACWNYFSFSSFLILPLLTRWYLKAVLL